MNEVSLTRDGTIYWNGARVSRVRLGRYLKTSRSLNPEPLVFLQTEMGVSCRTLDAVRDQIDQALECSQAYSSCAEGIKSVWGKLPAAPGSPVS
jgi:hypothetical protein